MSGVINFDAGVDGPAVQTLAKFFAKRCLPAEKLKTIAETQQTFTACGKTFTRDKTRTAVALVLSVDDDAPTAERPAKAPKLIQMGAPPPAPVPPPQGPVAEEPIAEEPIEIRRRGGRKLIPGYCRRQPPNCAGGGA